MEGSGSVQIIIDPDPRDPKTYGSYGSGSGTLANWYSRRLLWFEDEGTMDASAALPPAAKMGNATDGRICVCT